MAERSSDHSGPLVSGRQPLIGLPVQGDGHQAVRYFTEEQDADRFVSSGVDEALGLAGAWSDLDWGDMEEALDRIRHESEPTTP